MWYLACTVCLAVTAMANAAAATPAMTVEDLGQAMSSTQNSVAELSRAIAEMVKADEGIKNQLLRTTSAVVESQNAIQKIFASSSYKKKGEDDKDAGMGDGFMKQFASQLIHSIQAYAARDGNGSRSSDNSPILRDILAELRNLNEHFQKHLASLACPPPFMMLGSECFNVILEDMSWSDARNNCLRMGADLAQPTNITELKLYVGQKYPRKNQRNFWIGGVLGEKEWEWLSGEPLPEGYWHTNEPSGNGNCLALFDGWENPFTDFPCERERRAICQRK